MSYRADLAAALQAVGPSGRVRRAGAQQASIMAAVGKWVVADSVRPPAGAVPSEDATEPTGWPRLAAVPLSPASATMVGADGVDVGALPPADAAVMDLLTGATDGHGGPLLGVAVGAFHVAAGCPPGWDWPDCAGDDADGNSANEDQRLSGMDDGGEGSETDPEWDAPLIGCPEGAERRREELLVSSLPWVTVPEGVRIPMGDASLHRNADLLWPPSVEVSNEEDVVRGAGGAKDAADGSAEEALYEAPPPTVVAIFWPRVWADEVWAQGGLWAALARVGAMASTAAAAGTTPPPEAASTLQAAVAAAARPGCDVGDVPPLAVAPVLHAAAAIGDDHTATAVLARLAAPSLPPDTASAPADPPRPPRGLWSHNDAAAVARLARRWGTAGRRDELALLRRVVAAGGGASLVAVRWLAAELSSRRFQAAPDGAVGAAAAGVAEAAQIHCMAAARLDVPDAVAAVQATFSPSSPVSDMAELFSHVMTGNNAASSSPTSLALAAMGRLAVDGLADISPSELPRVTRLFTHLLSLGDCVSVHKLYLVLADRPKAVALQMLVAVLTDPGVLAAGTHRWQTPGRDEATVAFRPVVAAFVELATRVTARPPLPTTCIPEALPPQEVTSAPVPGSDVTAFLRGPEMEHQVGPFRGGSLPAAAWVAALISGGGAPIGGYDVAAVPVTLASGMCVRVTKDRAATGRRAAASHAALVAAVAHLRPLLRGRARGTAGAAAPTADDPLLDTSAMAGATREGPRSSPGSSCPSPTKLVKRLSLPTAAVSDPSDDGKTCTPPGSAPEARAVVLSPRRSKRTRIR